MKSPVIPAPPIALALLAAVLLAGVWPVAAVAEGMADPASPATPSLKVADGAAPPAADKPVPTRAALRAMARREAGAADVPYDLVDAVMKVESDYRPDRVGDVGEIGLMQIRPGTAAMLGFRGSPAELADPAINIHLGTAYLAGAWHQAHGNVCRALMKYRAGHGNESMTPLSVSYCQRARQHLAGAGSPLALTIAPADLVADASGREADAGAMPVPRPDLGAAAPPGESLTENGKPKRGAAFWSAMEARVRRINAGLEAKWRRTAAR